MNLNLILILGNPGAVNRVGLGLGFRDEFFRPEWPDPWISKDAQSLSLVAKYEF